MRKQCLFSTSSISDIFAAYVAPVYRVTQELGSLLFMLIMPLKRPPLSRESASEVARFPTLRFCFAICGLVLNKYILNGFELCFKLRHFLAQSGLRPPELDRGDLLAFLISFIR